MNEQEVELQKRTDEGAQELQPTKTRTRELVITGGGMWPEEDELGDTMIINMGPQHPSTHGVLRLMMELDSEEVVRIKPSSGTAPAWKTGEELTYVQGGTNVTHGTTHLSPTSSFTFAVGVCST